MKENKVIGDKIGNMKSDDEKSEDDFRSFYRQEKKFIPNGYLIIGQYSNQIQKMKMVENIKNDRILKM